MSSTKITTPADAHRAGRFVLATADNDGAQVAAIVAEMAADPPSFLRFALELAAISIGLAEQHVGQDWRGVLGSALLDLEVEHLPGGDRQ